MGNKNKIYQKFIVLFLTILILDYTFISFFDGWRFTKPIYYNIFWALHYSSIISLIAFSIIYIFEKLNLGCLTLLCLIWIIIFVGQFNPIDTYEYPHDIKVISVNGNEKIVVREAKSGKTNEIKVDTVKVIDKFIFRKVLEK